MDHLQLGDKLYLVTPNPEAEQHTVGLSRALTLSGSLAFCLQETDPIPSLTVPESQRADSNSHQSGKRASEKQRRRGQEQENGVLVSLRNARMTSAFFSAGTKPPTPPPGGVPATSLLERRIPRFHHPDLSQSEDSHTPCGPHPQIYP